MKWLQKSWEWHPYCIHCFATQYKNLNLSLFHKVFSLWARVEKTLHSFNWRLAVQRLMIKSFPSIICDYRKHVQDISFFSLIQHQILQNVAMALCSLLSYQSSSDESNIKKQYIINAFTAWFYQKLIVDIVATGQPWPLTKSDYKQKKL